MRKFLSSPTLVMGLFSYIIIATMLIMVAFTVPLMLIIIAPAFIFCGVVLWSPYKDEWKKVFSNEPSTRTS